MVRRVKVAPRVADHVDAVRGDPAISRQLGAIVTAPPRLRGA